MPEVYQRSEQPNEEGVALKACLRSAQGCGNCCLWRSETILSLEHRGHQWQDAFQSSSGRLTWHGMLSRAAGYGVVPLLGGSSDAVTRVMTPTKQRCTARRVFNLGSDGRLGSFSSKVGVGEDAATGFVIGEHLKIPSQMRRRERAALELATCRSTSAKESGSAREA